MEIEIMKPYSKAPLNTLRGMIAQKPILYVNVDTEPYIYMWADLRLTNHSPNRREFVLSATLHLKKRHWIFWHKTLAQAPVRKHTTGGMESSGPLLENLAIEPMTTPLTITVDAKGPIQTPLRPSQKVVFCLEFQMIGPIRRIRRIIEPKLLGL